MRPPPLTAPLHRAARMVKVGSSIYFRERQGTLWRVVGPAGEGHNVVLVGRHSERVRVAELASGKVLHRGHA